MEIISDYTRKTKERHSEKCASTLSWTWTLYIIQDTKSNAQRVGVGCGVRKYEEFRRKIKASKSPTKSTLRHSEKMQVFVVKRKGFGLKFLWWFAMVFCGFCIQMSESLEPI